MNKNTFKKIAVMLITDNIENVTKNLKEMGSRRRFMLVRITNS